MFSNSAWCEAAQLIQVGNVAVDTQVTPDEIVTYEKIAERELTLHVFYAKQANKTASNEEDKAPALLLFHGGGWNSGTPKKFYDQASYFSQLGSTVISVEYRLWGVDKTPPNVAVMDAKSAYRWVIANAKRLRIDANNIAAGGASAGGH